jgi:hypothetical protein
MFDSPTTLYIYTSCLFVRDDAAHPKDPLSARCSCGDLQMVSHIISSAHLIRLTEMEVVVLCVANGDQEANDVNEGCAGSVLVFPRASRRLKDSARVLPCPAGCTHASLMGSCPCISSGSVREDPWPRARELDHGAASRRSSRPSACGQRWGRSR